MWQGWTASPRADFADFQPPHLSAPPSSHPIDSQAYMGDDSIALMESTLPSK